LGIAVIMLKSFESISCNLLILQLSSFGTEDHAYTLPHLLHTTNATQIDLVLENMPTSHETSRFAVNLISVSSDPKDASFIVKKHKSLDDEHSPGIFTVSIFFSSKIWDVKR
jgi:hypothetical protein